LSSTGCAGAKEAESPTIQRTAKTHRRSFFIFDFSFLSCVEIDESCLYESFLTLASRL
jgi:hypothetical protein